MSNVDAWIETLKDQEPQWREQLDDNPRGLGSARSGRLSAGRLDSQSFDDDSSRSIGSRLFGGNRRSQGHSRSGLSSPIKKVLIGIVGIVAILLGMMAASRLLAPSSDTNGNHVLQGSGFGNGQAAGAGIGQGDFAQGAVPHSGNPQSAYGHSGGSSDGNALGNLLSDGNNKSNHHGPQAQGSGQDSGQGGGQGRGQGRGESSGQGSLAGDGDPSSQGLGGNSAQALGDNAGRVGSQHGLGYTHRGAGNSTGGEEITEPTWAGEDQPVSAAMFSEAANSVIPGMPGRVVSNLPEHHKTSAVASVTEFLYRKKATIRVLWIGVMAAQPYQTEVTLLTVQAKWIQNNTLRMGLFSVPINGKGIAIATPWVETLNPQGLFSPTGEPKEQLYAPQVLQAAVDAGWRKVAVVASQKHPSFDHVIVARIQGIPPGEGDVPTATTLWCVGQGDSWRIITAS